MPPKISRHGGPSFEEPNVKIKRPSLMPGATDRTGGESPSVGSNSNPSETTQELNENSEKANHPQPAPTTESPSNQTTQETSDVDSTDGPTPATEMGFDDEYDPNTDSIPEVEKPTRRATARTTRKTANTRSVTTNDFD